MRHDELLDIEGYTNLRKKVISMSVRGRLEERKRGSRINAIDDEETAGSNGFIEMPMLPDGIPEGSEIYFTTPGKKPTTIGKYSTGPGRLGHQSAPRNQK